MPHDYPSFVEVAEELRRRLQVAGPFIADVPEGYVATHTAVLGAERVMAEQAFTYLYSHLTYYEQWERAAILAAYCWPWALRGGKHLAEVWAHVIANVEQVASPATERAGLYLDNVHQMEDEWVTNPASMPPRAYYWLSVVRMREAKTALEYATGCGANVLQSAVLDPSVQWRGTDISKSQIAAAANQAQRVGASAYFAPLEDEVLLAGSDVVAVLDTLEHTVHPHELLDDAERYCAEGGVVVVSVPNGPWGPQTPKVGAGMGDVVGQHVASQAIEGLGAMLGDRGSILDLRLVPGVVAAEGNSSVCVTYKPGGGDSRTMLVR